MMTDELILFRGITRFDVLRQMTHYMEQEVADASLYECIYALLEFAAGHGFSGNIWHAYLTERLANDENAYSLACERNAGDVQALHRAAVHDLTLIRAWYDFDWASFADRADQPVLKEILHYTPDTDASVIYNRSIRDRIGALAARMAAAKDAVEMCTLLRTFYRDCGVGALGLHKAFRVAATPAGAVIEPIRNIRHVHLDDLIGYTRAKEKLIANTEAFLEGRPANNCLLYGDAGTGKSTSIKAITNTYFDRGLRVIELYKHQAGLLHEVIDQIKNRNYRFIVYMDDLSFEDFETEYKYLKAVIEGGLEKKPENVLIYATSNRRHLIKESFRDKPQILDDDIHRGDTVQEKLSLAYRFGVHIYFGSPDKEGYEEIVRGLAQRAGIDMEEDALLKEATRWEMTHGGKSGRTATQFIDDLAGRKR